MTKDAAHSAGPALHAGWRSELDSVLIHMLGLLLVPEPCRGKKRPSTGHQLRVLKEAKLGMFSRYWSVCGCLQEEGHTCSLYGFCIYVSLWKLIRVSMCALVFCVSDARVQSKEARQRVGAAGEGIPAQATCHQPEHEVGRTQLQQALRANVPSCAIAAVLVVAAGLVCCRPTIGQRGMQSPTSFRFTNSI